MNPFRWQIGCGCEVTDVGPDTFHLCPVGRRLYQEKLAAFGMATKPGATDADFDRALDTGLDFQSHWAKDPVG